MRYFFIFLCVIFFTCQTTKAPEINYLEESKEAFDARMDWWRDATFGMFIHWGPYAVPAGIHNGDSIKGIGEWIMSRASIPVEEYEKYVKQFNPIKFNARTWAGLAKEAGMKYMVITSKHHDGFCLWDSKTSDYDILDASPFKRDILAELKEACDEVGVKLCFYHSIMDWHHPDAQAPHYPTYNTKEKSNPNFPNYYENYLKPQVRELVEGYDPPVMWYDGEWIPEFTHEMGLDFYQYNRSLKPEMIINNRVDKGRQGMQGMNKKDGLDYAGDFGTPEQEILESTSSFDWEACMTMNDTWGYKSYDHNWKSAETLIHNLADIAAKGGNYLLNVGPTAEGLIPEPSVERLKEMGTWLRVNGEAIIATERLNQYQEGSSVLFTKSKDEKYIYAILLEWPGEVLNLKQVVPKSGTTIALLGSNIQVPWKTENDQTIIQFSPSLQQPDQRPCAYAWVLKIEGTERN